jgi:hypothetical protein
LAAAAVGLDPGIGVLHVDTDARDSLACDLMEPARPHVDAYLLKWITDGPLRREWFFEQRDGNCRLMGSFAIRLSESLSTWSRVVAPIAEWISRTVWSTARKPARLMLPPTHLTQSHRRQAKGKLNPPIADPPQPPRLCRICGATSRLDTTTVHPAQSLLALMSLSRVRKKADLLRIVLKHRRTGLKKDAETLPLGGLGDRRANRLGLTNRAIEKKYSLAWRD